MVQVQEAMSSKVLWVSPETRAQEAARMATEARVRHLLVLRHRRVVGVLCTCDLEDLAGLEEVGVHMSSPVLTACPLDSLEWAAGCMQRAGIGCLPVVALTGEVLGVITRGDLRRAGVMVERRRCNACGSARHVQRRPEAGFVSFCAECLASVRADALEYQDLGGGD